MNHNKELLRSPWVNRKPVRHSLGITGPAGCCFPTQKAVNRKIQQEFRVFWFKV